MNGMQLFANTAEALAAKEAAEILAWLQDHDIRLTRRPGSREEEWELMVWQVRTEAPKIYYGLTLHAVVLAAMKAEGGWQCPAPCLTHNPSNYKICQRCKKEKP